jgi:hypothetical protein
MAIFMVALFSVAKLWKQLICPKTDEWIKTIKMEFYSTIRKNDTMEA